MTDRPACCAAFLMLLACVSHAESLVSVDTTRIDQLPEQTPVSEVFTVGGSLAALAAGQTWLLDGPGSQWRSTDWRPQGAVGAVISGSTRAFVLTGSEDGDPAMRVEAVSLASGVLVSAPLPPLPLELQAAHGAEFDGRLFIAGTAGDGTVQLVAINPSGKDPEWHSYRSPSTIPAAVSSVTAQDSALFVTMNDRRAQGERIVQWTAADGWRERGLVPGSITGGEGRAVGQAHLLYFVARDSDRTTQPVLMSFHTITGSWATHSELDELPAHSVTGWKDGLAWVQRASDGSDQFRVAELRSGMHHLAFLDWVVLIAYLSSVLGIGLYFYRQDAQDSSADYFLGGRAMPFWAVGVSLYASNVSTISFIAIPAKAFATNWQYLMSPLLNVFGLMFVAVWIVPLLRRLNLTSTFHYLETRFHPSIRTLSSALAIVYELGSRMTIILFLPSLAISTVTGVDIVWSILITGSVTIIYTVLGGMKAVVWTDVLQLFVMFGGAIFAISVMMMSVDGGVSQFWSAASSDNKMKMVDWSFDFTEATVWGFILLIMFDTVLTFPKNQVLMQRVLSTPSEKQASRSVWTFAALIIPGSIMFFLIGTSLYVYYQARPERMDPLLPVDATFPLFIATELPIGITGLIIAGIFAASMSTLSSTLNSVAALVTVDFYEKIRKTEPNGRANVRFAELVTLVAGLIGIGLALLLSRFEIRSLVDVSLTLWGLLGGGFAGAYTLGMFSRTANWQGVMIGVAVSTVVIVYAWLVELVHPYFYLPLSIFICIVVGYIASRFFPPPTVVRGLTIYTDAIGAARPQAD